jgi:hypothetical protein
MRWGRSGGREVGKDGGEGFVHDGGRRRQRDRGRSDQGNRIGRKRLDRLKVSRVGTEQVL